MVVKLKLFRKLDINRYYKQSDNFNDDRCYEKFTEIPTVSRIAKIPDDLRYACIGEFGKYHCR